MDVKILLFGLFVGVFFFIKDFILCVKGMFCMDGSNFFSLELDSEDDFFIKWF